MEANKYIRVSYTLYTIDGEEREQIEVASRENPFMFISGLGVTLDTFESQIVPLGNGVKFDFCLTPEQAYGEYDNDRVVEVPRNIFEIDGKIDPKYIYEGAVVPLQNADGMRFQGTIEKIGTDTITVDLNHPLAGSTLNFVGEVIENRDATNDEIQGMLKFLTGEGCGGGCGSCGGGCGGCGGGSCGEGGCDCGEDGCNCGK